MQTCLSRASLRICILLAFLCADVALAIPPAALFGRAPGTPLTVTCEGCPPARVADVQRAMDEGLRAMARGMREHNGRAYANAFMLFEHGYAESRDPAFRYLQATMDRLQGSCADALRHFDAFVQAERNVPGFQTQIKPIAKQFEDFRKECAWQGASSPAAMEKRLRDFAAKHAGVPLRLTPGPNDIALRTHCGLNGVCDETSPYRMLMGQNETMHIQLMFEPTIVGRERSVDVVAAFQYADFQVKFPELSALTWGVSGDSFKFLMRKGDPRIQTMTWKDGLLHMVVLAEVTQLQAESTVERCRGGDHPKTCFVRVPAHFPLEIDFTLPMEEGPLDCRDKTMPDYAYRCG